MQLFVKLLILLIFVRFPLLAFVFGVAVCSIEKEGFYVNDVIDQSAAVTRYFTLGEAIDNIAFST